MIDPLSKTVLKQEHVSLPALVAVGAIHIGLLWIMLQAAPSLQTSRNVVYQILSPITRLRELVPSGPAVVQRAIQEVRGPIATVNPIQEKKPTERPPEKKRAIAPEALPEVKPVQLAQETPPGSIALGCIYSICRRTAIFAQKLAPEHPKVFFSGGLAQSQVVREVLAR